MVPWTSNIGTRILGMRPSNLFSQAYQVILMPPAKVTPSRLPLVLESVKSWGNYVTLNWGGGGEGLKQFLFSSLFRTSLYMNDLR